MNIQKRVLFLVVCFLMGILLIVSCKNTSVLNQPTAASQTPNLLSRTPTPTPTHVSTATLSPSATSVYTGLPVITRENAADIDELARLSKGSIQQGKWLPDGKHIAVATAAGVYIYEVKSGNEVKFFDTTILQGIAISPDGRLLATCEGSIVRVWDIQSGKERYQFREGDQRVTSAVFSLDGQFLAVERIIQKEQGEGEIEEVQGVQTWDLRTGELLYILLARSNPAFDISSRFLAVYFDHKVEFWEAGTGKLINYFENDRYFAFNPDGHSIAVTVDKTPDTFDTSIIKQKDMITDKVYCTFESDDHRPDLVYSSDGNLLAVSGKPGAVEVWDMKNCRHLQSFRGHFGYVEFIFSPDSRFLITRGRAGGSVRLWDIRLGSLLKEIEGFYGDFGSINPDGRLLIERYKNTMALWDIKTGKKVATFDNHDSLVSSVAFSPDGQSILTFSCGDITLSSVETGRLIKRFHGFSYVLDVAFSPDGQSIAAAGIMRMNDTDEAALRVWDIKTGQLKIIWNGQPTSRELKVQIDFSSDSRTLAVASSWDDTINLWNIERAQIKHTLVIDGAKSDLRIAFVPNSQTLGVKTAGNTIQLWDAEKGQQLNELRSDGDSGGAGELAVSRSGTLLAAASYDTVWLWDLVSKENTKLFEDSAKNISTIAVSPDGKILALAGWVGVGDIYEIRLWDITSNQLLASMRNNSAWIRGLDFSPDGRLLVSTGADGTIRLWGVKP